MSASKTGWEMIREATKFEEAWNGIKRAIIYDVKTKDFQKISSTEKIENLSLIDTAYTKYIDNFTKDKKYNPFFAKALSLIGNEYLASKSFDEAKQYYNRALVFNKNDEIAINGLDGLELIQIPKPPETPKQAVKQPETKKELDPSAKRRKELYSYKHPMSLYDPDPEDKKPGESKSDSTTKGHESPAKKIIDAGPGNSGPGHTKS